MKKFTGYLSLLLALATGLSIAGCASNSANAVVARVDGVEIYRWQVDNMYKENVGYYEQTTGIKLDEAKNTEKRVTFRKSLLDDLVGDIAVTQKAKALGYDLTEAEKAEFEKEYEEYVADQIQYFVDNQFKDDPDAQNKARAEWEAYNKAQNVTEEYLKQDKYNRKVRTKFSNELFKDITAKEEDLLAIYDQMVIDDKAKYTETPGLYGEDAALPNNRAAYRPAGYVRIKQILVSLPKDIDDQIKELSLKQAQALIDMQDISQEKGKNDPAIVDLDKQSKDLQTQIDELFEKGYEQILPKAEEAYNKLQAGATFDAVLKEYNDDEGMTVYPTNEYGYLVGPNSKFVSGFKEAALALKGKEVGSLSNVVKSVHGYHIVCLIDDVQEGPVPFENLRDFITSLNTATPIQETLKMYTAETVAEFNRENKIEVFYNKL